MSGKQVLSALIRHLHHTGVILGLTPECLCGSARVLRKLSEVPSQGLASDHCFLRAAPLPQPPGDLSDLWLLSLGTGCGRSCYVS